MDRRRGVIAAAGVSAFLLMGTAAVAVGSDALSTRPVDRVGTFQAIEARLVPISEATTRPSTSTTKTRPARSEPTGHPTPTGHSTTVPGTESPTAPVVVSPSAPAVVVPVTTTTIARGRSVSGSRKREDDPTGKVPHGGPGTDD